MLRVFVSVSQQESAGETFSRAAAAEVSRLFTQSFSLVGRSHRSPGFVFASSCHVAVDISTLTTTPISHFAL